MSHTTHPRRPALVIVTVTALAGVLAACGEGGASNDDPSAPPSKTAFTPESAPLPDGVIDPFVLPLGEPPAIDHAIGTTLVLDGRPLQTDLPGTSVQIMGTVDGRVVVAGGVPDEVGTHFWAVDESGRAQRLGRGGYESYDYSPILVEQTGHLWVTFSDRGTGRGVVWEIDARTGEELRELTSEEEPAGLEPADQAVLDVLYGRSELPADPGALSPDGLHRVSIGFEGSAGDSDRSVLEVRTVADRRVVARVPFALAPELADFQEIFSRCTGRPRRCTAWVDMESAPYFEDDRHVLAEVSVGVADDARGEPVFVSTVVRCDLDGRCERTIDDEREVNLGVDPSAP
ncbi:hypothetical protein [Nocardioides sp. cx-173]|uniref:hypothetical protein n=1 Tax=Nocardioides sp. cx-173 TaxID=2898796 RepID=UPI001E50DCE0|nr:hypothetical protein [Nocardioides sp. cx-173]MCD4527000.1 hypothetical protein [Nocardioides sp. cx-173]UGB41065.1 hypothetical protein LQ940_17045 [Nocardioides sp. cx-173]